MIVIDPKKEVPVSGTITGRVGAAYLVATASGRTIRAESSDTFAIGSTVVVLSGQIIGRSGGKQPAKIYEV